MEGLEIEKILSLYKNKKVLVTGHTGFKGSWLSIWLNQLGADVSGIGLDPVSSKDLFELGNISRTVDDIRLDIRNKEALFETFYAIQPEIVFHLAAQPLVMESYENPLETFEVNTIGTANVLEAIRKTDSVKTVILVTTDKVYDNKEWLYSYREYDKLGGHDPYSASKGACEIVIDSYRKSFYNFSKLEATKKSIASVRAGNVIGGGDWAKNRIVPDCINAIKSEKSIEVRNPSSIRPWQHVLEPLGGYLLLGGKMMEAPEKFNEAWNFGPEDKNIIEVSKLVKLIIRNYKKGIWNDTSNANFPHEARLLALDITKARQVLGWKPTLDIEETVEFTVKWYKDYESTDVYELCCKQIKDYLKIWKLRS